MNKYMKMNKITVLSIIALILFVTLTFVVACEKTPTEGFEGKKEYTLTFVTNGGTEVQPITAFAGASIPKVSDPQKSDDNGNYVFCGWFLTSDFSGESVSIPEKMPTENKTFYAKFELDKTEEFVTIEYKINLEGVSYNAIEDGKTQNINEYKTADGASFGLEGYLFLCWTTTPNGAFSLQGGKEKGQYYANEIINSNDKHIVLYAHWGKEYVDAYGKSEDKIYVCEEIIGKGIGAVTLVCEGKENKLGFVDNEKLAEYGYSEFTFYYDDEEGGEVSGRLYPEQQKYAFPDGIKGEYLNYSYETQEALPYILALDGFGGSMILELVGSQTSVSNYGVYEYDEEYGDYVFVELDSATQEPLLDDNGNPIEYYFIIESQKVENTEFNGYFLLQGYESGSYMLYDNGDLCDYRLDLNGYGSAHLYMFDQINETTELIASGKYKAYGEDHTVFGEWEFASESENFRFILSYVTGNDESITIYIEYDETMNKTFTDETGNGDTLYLDGYGGAMYTSNSLVFEGNCTVSKNLVTFLPYSEDENGNLIAGKKLYFNLDMNKMTFNVNSDGFICEENTLVKYEGESEIVVIPENITAIGDNAFNYTYTNVSLVSVTIPSGVMSIGKHSFQNNYSLQRAIFLSETPIDIDWSADGDPFRWGAGNFVIVVPEDSKDAYKTAWADCKYVIKGSIEITIVPEFEVENGVLVKYNKQSDSAELLDLKIPDEVIEIAKNVFRGLTYIKSVDFNNVTKIGEDAFYGNTALVSANFANVQIIESGAFMGCFNLGSESNGKIELLSITNIGANAFSSCESLKLVRLGGNLVSIGDFAFSECQVYVNEDALFVELLGETPPEMGGKISIGNISFRIKVPNIDVAVKCFNTPTWNSYVKHLFIESGEEKGIYMNGTEKLELNGRAEFSGSEIMLYAINSEAIRFYHYNSEDATYSVYFGEIKDNKISITIGNDVVVYTKVSEKETYVSEDGYYTLVCNPKDLLPETYEDSGYVGVADGTLNGVPVKINVSGYNSRVIKNYLENGKLYDITFILEGNVFVYTKKIADSYVRNITAEDGSVLNLHYSGSLIYVFGELMIEVEDGKNMPSWGDYGVIATETAPNVYEFKRNYKGTNYEIKITLNNELTTFTYVYKIA